MGIKGKQTPCSPLTGSSPQLNECGHVSPNCTARTSSPVPSRKQAASPQLKRRYGSCARHLDRAGEGCRAHPGQWKARPALGASAPRQEWPRAPATRLFQATLPGRKEAPTPALPGVEGPGGPQITALRHQTTTCRSFSALLATLPNVPGQFHPETLSDLPQPHSSDGASLGIWVCSAPEPGCSPLPRKDSLALASAPNRLRM